MGIPSQIYSPLGIVRRWAGSACSVAGASPELLGRGQELAVLLGRVQSSWGVCRRYHSVRRKKLHRLTPAVYPFRDPTHVQCEVRLMDKQLEFYALTSRGINSSYSKSDNSLPLWHGVYPFYVDNMTHLRGPQLYIVVPKTHYRSESLRHMTDVYTTTLLVGSNSCLYIPEVDGKGWIKP
jgi:hypothetical protein